jgi:hypothetical protein
MPWLLYPQHITPVSIQQRAGLGPSRCVRLLRRKKNHLLYQAFEPRTAQARSYAIPAAVWCADTHFHWLSYTLFVLYLTTLSTTQNIGSNGRT